MYEVRRTRDDVRLALKVLSGTVGVREMARFAREAKLAATVHHANVVTILDVAVSSRGFLFLVLELVDGDPLHRRRERFGDVPWALRVLHGIVKGLAAIHREGIVHRDLKPANVLVREDATGTPTTVKITDFGISNAAPTSSGGSKETPDGSTDPRVSGDDVSGNEDPTAPARPNPAAASARSPPTRPEAPATKDHETTGPGAGAGEAALPRPAGPLTQTGMILGTPAYMAPEVMRSARSSSTASDVYSFGVLAFELVHARRPFSEAQAAARAFGHFDAEGPPMEALGVPARLAAAFAAALAIDPLERPTAAELERMLEDALAR